MSIIQRIFNTLLPQPCICCHGRLIGGEKYVCLHCMSSFPRNVFIKDIHDNELARVFWGTFAIEAATTPYIYQPGGILTPVVHKMKYSYRPDLCQQVGMILAKTTIKSGIFADADMLVPVPLTKERRKERGYNQSEEMCRGISELTQLPVVTDVLTRKFFHGSQASLDHSSREENVRGAFEVHNASILENKHIILVDDLVTTGSTMRECLYVLRDIPGIRISILALAWSRL